MAIDDGQLYVWNTVDGELAFTTPIRSHFPGIAISPDSRTLAIEQLGRLSWEISQVTKDLAGSSYIATKAIKIQTCYVPSNTCYNFRTEFYQSDRNTLSPLELYELTGRWYILHPQSEPISKNEIKRI